MLVKVTLDSQNIDTLVRLQTILCLVLFLLGSSRITAAHAYMTRVSAATSMSYLRPQRESGAPPSQPDQTSYKALVRAAVSLDTYICGLLGVSPTVKPVLPQTTLLEVFDRGSIQLTELRRDQRRTLEIVASELQIRLFGILSDNALSEMDASTSAQTLESLGQESALRRTSTYTAEKELQWWSVQFGNVFPQGEVNPQIAR